ncbi:hypothetical protein F4779DRAFT_605751 [Xylariaceae sp. FL0662B]|nr:hypothetical protein F4779DRAFT_605751 [Xylariaceae sp. FL0662B]
MIKESLRLMALPTRRPPLISPKEPLRYKDWIIPAGIPISTTVRDALLDLDVYKDPFEF